MTARFNRLTTTVILTLLVTVSFGTMLFVGCGSFIVPTKTRTLSTLAVQSVASVRGFPEESGGIFRRLRAKSLLWTAPSQDPQKACEHFLKAYQKDFRAYDLSRLEIAVASCEAAGDYKTAKVFLDFKERYVETHPYERFHTESRWQRSSHRRWQRRSEATLRKDFEETLSEQPRYEPTVNYAPLKQAAPSAQAYESVIPYYRYEKK